LQRNGVPVKMLWFCGGHGSCLTDAGDPDRVERATIAWLERWLARKKKVRTGPGFDWINQDGDRFKAKSFPPPKRKPIVTEGSGNLPITQAGGSGPSKPGAGPVGAIAVATNGTRASNAVNLTIPGRKKASQVVGAPRLALHYSGTASSADVRVFAQIVDDETDVVLGNQVTPIPLLLDGSDHQVSRRLEAVAATLRPGSSFTLQLTSSATNYGLQRVTGTVDFDSVKLTLPRAKLKHR
jgi:ABC-2 type transport system ATP-binding protein